MSFVHLQCRSYFSLKDGAFSPEDLALKAAELGMPAVAMTDRDGLYGAARLADACRQVGVKPILGARLTLDDGKRRVPAEGGGGARSGGSAAETSRRERGRGVAAREGARGLGGTRASPSESERAGETKRLRGAAPPPPTSVVLLARDARGYGNLCRLITQAHMSGERGDPALTPREVMAHAEGLVCLLGPESSPGTLALSGRPGAAREMTRPWREAFGPWCFLEVRDLLEPGSAAEVRTMLRLAEEAGLPAVATNAVRYMVPEDAYLADALECMREIVPVASHHVTRRNAEGWLKPPAEMRELFRDRPDLCDNTVWPTSWRR